MAKQVIERPTDAQVLRRVGGKTVRVQVLLRPETAEKLRVAAVGLGLDLGDLVTAGLTPLLKQIQVTVRHVPSTPGQAGPVGGSGSSPAAAPDGLRVAG